MLKKNLIFITIILSIFIISHDSFSQDYKQDSLAVRAILDANGKYGTLVEGVTDTNEGRIIVLGLPAEQLDTIPPEIGILTALKRLFIQFNNIANLPHEIGNLYNLTELLIYSNNLTGIPSEIGNLSNLKLLSLHKNEISSVPQQIGNLTNLTKLYLNENKLSDLPDSIISDFRHSKSD